MIANCKFVKYGYEEMGDDQILESKIATDMITNQTQIQFEEGDHNIAHILNQRAHNVELQGSGFDFQHIIELSIHMYLFSDVKGKSYVKPPFTHQSVLNNKNNDKLCFLRCILACIPPVDSKNHSSRVSRHEAYIDELNVENFDRKDGMKIKDISKFEKQNEKLLINVFNLCKNKDDKNILAPLDISKNNRNKTIVNLLLHKNHYILFKKLHAYVGNIHDHKFVCRNCLSCYGSEDSLNQHRILS